MKKLKFFPLVFLSLLLFSCQEKVDPETEKQAIIDVINEETQAYMDVDFESLVSYFVHDSLTIRLGVGADDVKLFEGWNSIEDAYRKDLLSGETTPESNNHIKVTKDNFRIKLYENTAYVTCTEKWTYSLEDTTMEIDSRQIRFMEKVDGEWKIAFLSFIGTSGYEEEAELEDMGFEFNKVPVAK